MGMAASQARLLTITSRLNHIELEAQNVSNAKIRLSDKTQEASDEYIAALNKTKYLYNYYDGSGAKVSMSLTGAALTTYGELKNQYGLINSAGQILVSELDAKNYESSNTLEEFLEKYGVLGELGEGDKIEVTNPDYETAMDEYNKDYEEWLTQKPDPSNPIYVIPGEPTEGYDLYDDFLWATAQCFSCAIGVLSGALGLPGGSLVDSEGNKIADYTDHVIKMYDKEGNVILNGSINYGINKNCYCHVFSHLLALGSYKTSTGKELSIYSSTVSESFSHWWPDGNGYSASTAAELAKVLSENADKVLYTCGDTGKDITENSSELELLMSDYYIDENGDKQLKTLQQKIVDLDYAMGNNLMSDQEAYDSIIHFVEHDLNGLKGSEDKFDQEAYDKDVAEWESREPQKPEVPQFITKEVRKITDMDKAQWYVNLWHRMNGTSDYRAGVGGDENFIAGEGWASKSKTDQSYAVLKDGDMNSPEYLKFAIENGLITLEQVQFIDPSKSEEGVENIEWTSIVFSAAQDVTEVKDEEAITKAEVKYEQAQRDIQAKDKEYETQMKKLDTEHNALQTEYDSIKSVIEKNVERSFKTFS